MLGKAEVIGIAREIAKSFEVTCTAAVGDGLAFWHRDGKGKIVRNNVEGSRKDMAPAKPPAWLWLEAKSKWVTYDPRGIELPHFDPSSGKKIPHVVMSQWLWDDAALTAPMPPKWLTDAYVY